MHGQRDDPFPGPRPAKPQHGDAAHRCRRCLKPVTDEEHERFFQRTGLCFWCAYVEPQG